MQSGDKAGRTTIGKKDIVVAATGLFLNDGYEQVSMRKIASQIGCSPTNLYNHFKNKEEILLFWWKQEACTNKPKFSPGSKL
jgi:AcrR family transcriptional regulator